VSDTRDNVLAVDAAAPAEIGELDLYQKREKIYTRAIQGRFQRLRTLTGWPLLLGYFCLPWINLFGQQSVLFDLPARKFHILTMTFWPQDFFMLAWLLIISAFGLFTVTALAGRVWCGYTCPQPCGQRSSCGSNSSLKAAVINASNSIKPPCHSRSFGGNL